MQNGGEARLVRRRLPPSECKGTIMAASRAIRRMVDARTARRSDVSDKRTDRYPG